MAGTFFLTIRIWTKFLFKGILILAGILALLWLWGNRSWIVYNSQRHYGRTEQGIRWETEIVEGCTRSRAEGKKMLLVFLKEGEAESGRIRKNLLEDPEFRLVQNNFVMMLVDLKKDLSSMKPREKAYCEELIKKFDIQQFGLFLVADTDPKEGNIRELHRLPYKNQKPAAILDALSDGGKFVPQKDVDSRPRLQKIPKLF